MELATESLEPLNFGNCSKVLVNTARRLGWVFLITDPKEYEVEKTKDVHHYLVDGLVFIYSAFLLVEIAFKFFGGEKVHRINNTLYNLSLGIVGQCIRLFSFHYQVKACQYIWDNWRIVTLPHDSVIVWIISFLAVDMLLYWMHRAGHEINMFWTTHQVHHSTTELDFTASSRLGVFDTLSLEMSPTVYAFIFPPTLILIHLQIILINEIWLHTDIIGHLGPLELIFNTPWHHQVHHGRTRETVDKNYALALIIWDRMFGTFYERKDKKEKIDYGLVHPVKSFNPLYNHTVNVKNIWERLFAYNKLSEKLSVIFKGPGWEPGKPWTGNVEDIPLIDKDHPTERHDPKIAFWKKAYVLLQGIIFAAIFSPIFTDLSHHHSSSKSLFLLGYSVLTSYTIGSILDGKRWAPLMEVIRLLSFFAYDNVFFSNIENEFGTYSGMFIKSLITLVKYESVVLSVFWLKHYFFMQTSFEEEEKAAIKAENNSRTRSIQVAVAASLVVLYGVLVTTSYLLDDKACGYDLDDWIVYFGMQNKVKWLSMITSKPVLSS